MTLYIDATVLQIATIAAVIALAVYRCLPAQRKGGE